MWRKMANDLKLKNPEKTPRKRREIESKFISQIHISIWLNHPNNYGNFNLL